MFYNQVLSEKRFKLSLTSLQQSLYVLTIMFCHSEELKFLPNSFFHYFFLI